MELIIIDEGFSPCPLFDKIDKPNVRYFFHDLKRGQLKLGRVRNRLNRYAKGPLIVNMDSDDFYAPDYVKWKVFKCSFTLHLMSFTLRLNYGRIILVLILLG